MPTVKASSRACHAIEGGHKSYNPTDVNARCPLCPLSACCYTCRVMTVAVSELAPCISTPSLGSAPPVTSRDRVPLGLARRVPAAYKCPASHAPLSLLTTTVEARIRPTPAAHRTSVPSDALPPSLPDLLGQAV